MSRAHVACALLIALVCGCKRPQAVSNGNSADLLSLNGQVFVVTRGAENIRLGELTVYLSPLTRFRDLHLDDVLKKKTGDLNEQFLIAKHRGDEREALVREIQSSYATLVQERDQLVALLPAAAILHEKYDIVRSQIAKQDRQLDEYAADLQATGRHSYSECEHIAAAASELPDTAADLVYQKLSPVSESCRTDADGRFHFQCAVDEEFVIFTRGHRDLPSGKKEKYQWFVYTRAERDPQRQVLLTNENQIGGFARENLFSSAMIRASSLDFDIPQSEPRILATRAPLPQEPHWAKPHVFYLLRYISLSTNTGVVGLPPGSELRERDRRPNGIITECGGSQCEVDFTLLTDNTDLATEVRNADSKIQSQIATWQGRQFEADRATRDEQNRQYDEAQKRIEKAYKRMHSLTGESRLNEPPHR